MSSRSEGDDLHADHGDGVEDRVNQFGSELAELSDEELESRATDSVEAHHALSEAAEEQLDKRGEWYGTQAEESVDAHHALSEEAERQLDKRREFLREEAEESLGFTEGWGA